MTEFIKTYTIDFDNLTVKEKEITDDWDNLICENDGYFSSEHQYIIFECEDNEMCINFSLSVYGNVDYDPGDYWTPSYTDVNITDVCVDITEIYFNDNNLSLPKEVIILLEEKIKNLI